MKKAEPKETPTESASGDAEEQNPTAASESDVARETESLGPEQLQTLKELAAKSSENRDLFLRTAADLDNFRKRAAREKQDAIKFGNESLLQKMIPILDNLEMALAAADTAEDRSLEAFRTGVSMIQQQFKAVLNEAGLEEIDAEGSTFDPNSHEAVSQQESTEVPEGQVLQQLRKGYRLKERLLRPATVIVAKSPSN